MELVGSFESYLHEWESHLRQGITEPVVAQLRTFWKTKGVPRRHLKDFANICRRTDQFMLGISALGPIVRGERAGDRASDMEVMEYCLCLKGIGMTSEALYRLQALDADKNPEALIYQVHCLVSQWNYQGTIPLLQKYINHHHEDSYRKIVARLNLAAAMRNTKQFDACKDQVAYIAATAGESGWRRILANSHEIMAQVYIDENEFEKAAHELKLARSLLRAEKIRDALYIDKWIAVVDARRTGNLRLLHKVREKAWHKGHWESCRDIDFQIAYVNRDQRLINKLYYQTPHQMFRDRISHLDVDIDSIFNPFSNSPPKYISREDPDHPLFKIETGSVTSQIMAALLSDAYQPADINYIFSYLFPEESFDPESSANRIHQDLFRSRKAIESFKLPIKIQEISGIYSLEVSERYEFAMTIDSIDEGGHVDIHHRNLAQIFGDNVFSRDEVCQQLLVSKDKAVRILNKIIGQGKIIKSGQGRSTKYQLKSA